MDKKIPVLTVACVGLFSLWMWSCGGGNVPKGQQGDVPIVIGDNGAWDAQADAQADADASRMSDSGTREGRLGWPCHENDECQSGICVETANGKVCTEMCMESCPAGWACRQVNWAGDDIFICVPRFLTLCDPCKTAKDCNPPLSAGGAGCIDHGPDGSFCGGDCSTGDCPDGYVCQDVNLPEGVKKQCVPASGECSCSKRAISLTAATECYVENSEGKCMGERKCTADGLSTCNARTPKAEECNDLDDNCNGQTDEGLVDVPCGVTNQYGTCKGTGKCVDGKVLECTARTPEPEKCDGIDNNCNGQTDEGGVCCKPKTCADLGQECGQADDGCGGTLDCGTCEGSMLCRDGKCVDHCGDGQCETELDENCDSCPADCGCSNGDVCYNNVCCTPMTCHGQGFECGTHSDGCGGTLDCGTCNDKLDCTADFCSDKGKCVNVLGKSDCLIDNKCYQKDAASPDNPCQFCDPDSDQHAWTTHDDSFDLGDGKVCFKGQPCKPKTCSDIGNPCGRGYDDGCGGTFDCSASCTVGLFQAEFTSGGSVGMSAPGYTMRGVMADWYDTRTRQSHGLTLQPGFDP